MDIEQCLTNKGFSKADTSGDIWRAGLLISCCFYGFFFFLFEKIQQLNHNKLETGEDNKKKIA